MKKSILFLSSICCLAITSCNQGTAQKTQKENIAVIENNDKKEGAVMTFDKAIHDFGVIDEGTIVEHTFNFTNTGTSPLIITNAKGSCGCTIPKWPKDPIAPGATGSLVVSFNSNGKPNIQNKQVTITANTEKGKEILKIKASVTPKAKKAVNIPASK